MDRTSVRLADFRTWLKAVAGGVLIVFCIAMGASFFNDSPRATTLVVFTLVLLPPATALAWVLFTRSAGSIEDNVEHSWETRAAAGAFRDLVLACGLLLVASMTVGVDPELPLSELLIYVLVGGGADSTVRYLALQAREN